MIPLRGHTLGGALLISGSCIGAGMLALPILTGLAGFYPSLLLFLISWAFMTFTALLLVEINGWFKGRVNIVSMAGEALGYWGKVISWVLYLFLFYALLIAYVAVVGEPFSHFLSRMFPLKVTSLSATLIFVALFGYVVYLGTKPVDLFNRFLMVGLLFAYFGMIFLGLDKITFSYFSHVEWKYAFIPLPILITSFGFHNMIPSLTTYMKGDLRKMKVAVLSGSLLVLAIYLIWEILVIGVVPYGGGNGLLESYHKGREATHSLRLILHSSSIGAFAQGFAFFAIITSFLAQSLGLMHFIADGLKVTPGKKNKLWLCLLTLAPPCFFGLLYPQIFFKALSFAGGICAVFLFGVLPAVMAWIGRYKKREKTTYRVAGGKVSLMIAIGVALIIAGVELVKLVRK